MTTFLGVLGMVLALALIGVAAGAVCGLFYVAAAWVIETCGF